MWKPIFIDDTLSTVDRVILFASEFCGTAIFLFVGCLSCLDFSEKGHLPGSIQIGLCFGLGIVIAAQCFGHVSGSHVNPAVTVAAVTIGNLPLIQIPFYIAGQFLGAIAGIGLLKALTPRTVLYITRNVTHFGVCSSSVRRDLGLVQAFFLEFAITFVLAMACCGIWDDRNLRNNDSVPIRIGVVVGALVIVGGPYTGASMNPARSFAAALLNNDWKDHWIYWIAPLGAGFLGALTYRFVFTKLLGGVYTSRQPSNASVKQFHGDR